MNMFFVSQLTGKPAVLNGEVGFSLSDCAC